MTSMTTPLRGAALIALVALATVACGKKETPMQQAINAMPPACQAYMEKAQACMQKHGGDEMMAAMQQQIDQQAEQMTAELRKASAEELAQMAQACEQMDAQLGPLFAQMGC